MQNCRSSVSHELARACVNKGKFHDFPSSSPRLSFGDRRYRSMSLTNGEVHWSAVRVRDTFLDYFKKNGHTFGMTIVEPQFSW